MRKCKIKKFNVRFIREMSKKNVPRVIRISSSIPVFLVVCRL